MKSSRNFSIGLIGFSVAMASWLQANTALIDFGRSGNATTSHAGATYNNVDVNLLDNSTAGTHIINGSGTSLALVTTANTSSGWSISLSKPNPGGAFGQTGPAGSGGDYLGSYPTAFPASVQAFAETALENGIFVNNNATLVVTISGLDNGRKYDLLTYGARLVTSPIAPAEAHTLTIGTATTGAAAQTVQVTSATSNSTVAPFWAGITPVGGQIQLAVDAVPGTSGRVNSINFLSLTEIPAPTYESWATQISNGRILRSEDADDDGFTNLQEFLFGTDPMAGDGSLSNSEESGDNLIIRWKQLTAGASYDLTKSETLANDWLPATGATLEADGSIAGEYQPMKATINIVPGNSFFRVEGVEN